jgi:hypothetical protein
MLRLRNHLPAEIPARSAAGGFSLVAVLLTLVGISFLAVAGFMLAMGDFLVARNEVASARAFYAADSGLNTVLGTARGYPADTTVLSNPTDTTTVTAMRLVQMAGGRRLYLLRSHARYHAADGSIGDRTVSLVLLADPDSTSLPPEVKRASWRETM